MSSDNSQNNWICFFAEVVVNGSPLTETVFEVSQKRRGPARSHAQAKEKESDRDFNSTDAESKSKSSDCINGTLHQMFQLMSFSLTLKGL